MSISSQSFFQSCIVLARESSQGSISSDDTDLTQLSLDDSDYSSNSSSAPPYTVPKLEALLYYSGLPSSPKLLYRTSAESRPWAMPTGPEAYRELKELHPVFRHKLSSVWGDVGPRVCELLDSQGVPWTSIDVVRFRTVREGSTTGPVVLWIGVPPDSVLGQDAHTSANSCLDVLRQFDIDDVEVEFRESTYTHAAGPKLLKPASKEDADVDVRGPLTPALGLSIAAIATPHAEGTGGIYLAEGGDSKKILLVTARHVLLPPIDRPNDDYIRKNTSVPKRDVILLGTQAFSNFTRSIKVRIGRHALMVSSQETKIQKYRVTMAGNDPVAAKKAEGLLEASQRLLDQARAAMQALDAFHSDALKTWKKTSQRVIGHLVRSPPISTNVGVKGFTEDYAVVELDRSKIEDAFQGNVIDLGTKMTEEEWNEKMYPRIDAPESFEYPDDRLLPLRDILSEDLMANPDMLDLDDQPCLFVLKNGSASGVTVGRANGIYSYVRRYFPNNTHQSSKEWSILPYNKASGAFSVAGDSGSIIVDGRGRVGGLLTGGAGLTTTSDITYATPFFWLLPRIKENGFPHAHLYPVMN